MPSVPTPPPGHRLLEGKTVVVTAAAGTGIGFATAQRCVAEGARVLISDLHERRLPRRAANARDRRQGAARRWVRRHPPRARSRR
jgi:3-oxoacyl-[acyl-carrier protein] reductase